MQFSNTLEYRLVDLIIGNKRVAARRVASGQNDGWQNHFFGEGMAHCRKALEITEDLAQDSVEVWGAMRGRAIVVHGLDDLASPLFSVPL